MLQDYSISDLASLLGPWLTTGLSAFDPTNFPPGRAILARNVAYQAVKAKTRYGYSQTGLTALGDSFLAMTGWFTPVAFQPPAEWIAYLAGPTSASPGFNVVTQGGIKTSLFQPAGSPAGAVFAPAGTRLYMTPIDNNGQGTDNPRVFSNATVAAPGGLDQLFQPPIPVNFMSAVSSGFLSSALGVTPGQHNIGFLMQTRNGYEGAASPVVGSAFTPLQTLITVSGQSMIVTVNANWPTAVTGIFLMMTTAANPSQYFLIPGATAAVLGGTTFTVNITVDIDDGTLAAVGTDATSFFNLFSGAMRASWIGEYGNRLVYIAPDAIGIPTIWASDPQNYQSLSLVRSVIYLPGQKVAMSAFSLYGNLYIVGPYWTYMTQDNGGDPVTWAPFQLIDGQIGTVAPNGAVATPAAGIAWVASVHGLYLFAGGAYAQRPVSYYQHTDWMRINWSAAACIKVVDDHEQHRVRVLAPLDGATQPTHMLTWDYIDGLAAEQVHYSLDSLQSYAIGACAMVRNESSKVAEFWLGPQATANPVLKENDGDETNPYRDNNQPIASTYQTGLLAFSKAVSQHIGDYLRLAGNGSVSITATTLDGGRSTPLNPVLLSNSPAQIYIRRYYLLSEAVSLTVSVNALDSWFELTSIRHLSKPWVLWR